MNVYQIILLSVFGGMTVVYTHSLLEWSLKQYNNFAQQMFIYALIGVIAVNRKNIRAAYRRNLLAPQPVPPAPVQPAQIPPESEPGPEPELPPESEPRSGPELPPPPSHEELPGTDVPAPAST